MALWARTNKLQYHIISYSTRIYRNQTTTRNSWIEQCRKRKIEKHLAMVGSRWLSNSLIFEHCVSLSHYTNHTIRWRSTDFFKLLSTESYHSRFARRMRCVVVVVVFFFLFIVFLLQLKFNATRCLSVQCNSYILKNLLCTRCAHSCCIDCRAACTQHTHTLFHSFAPPLSNRCDVNREQNRNTRSVCVCVCESIENWLLIANENILTSRVET